MEVLPGYRRAWTVFYARAKQALMEGKKGRWEGGRGQGRCGVPFCAPVFHSNSWRTGCSWGRGKAGANMPLMSLVGRKVRCLQLFLGTVSRDSGTWS